MSDDFPTADEIINGTGRAKPSEPPEHKPSEPPKPGLPPGSGGFLSPDGTVIPLTPDQHKALGLVLSGMPFLLIAIRETGEGADKTGSDFYTALNGDPVVLRNVKQHLEGVIERAYTRKGIV